MGVAEDTRFAELWNEARTIANREGFLALGGGLSGVWHRWQESCPEGGFDAVIGNPPWDQIEAAGSRMVRNPFDEEIAHDQQLAAKRGVTAIKKKRDQRQAINWQSWSTKRVRKPRLTAMRRVHSIIG